MFVVKRCQLVTPYRESDSWNIARNLKICSIPRELDTGEHLRFYQCLMEEPAPVPYIHSSISTNTRRIITMLICGCLLLEVETGRRRSPNTPLSNRTCQVHNDGSIGDEVHFLIGCQPLQSSLRGLQPRRELPHPSNWGKDDLSNATMFSCN